MGMHGQLSSGAKCPALCLEHSPVPCIVKALAIIYGCAGSLFAYVSNEPLRDKTNIMAFAPSEDSDQPGHLPSLISLRCPHEESLGP